MPHVHIVCRLKDCPEHRDKEGCINFIDEYISAKKPIINEESTEEDKRYADLVEKHMMHRCFHGVNGCLDSEGKCKKGFQSMQICLETHFDEKGFPVYAKLCEEDSMVISHCRDILLDNDCHVHVTFVASHFIIIYLFKYFFKGNKKVQMYLNNIDDIDPNDEIGRYLRGRLLSSMEAIYKIYGFQIYPATYPAVATIKIKSPNQMFGILKKGKTCDLNVYFKRPRDIEIEDLTFEQFFESYGYGKTKPINSLYIREIKLDQLSELLYIYKLQSSRKRVIRLNPIPIDCGELWYFRLILRHYPLRSFNAAKIVNDVTFNTYQESAIALGLVHDNNEAMIAFEECLIESSPHELRSMFVTLTLQGFRTIEIFNKHSNQEPYFLMQDYMEKNNFNKKLSINDLLINLHERFSKEDKELKNYGLPEPQVYLYIIFMR